jgi:competence protein CoiA
MQFALLNGFKSEAQPNSKAICPHCGSAVLAKCGSKNVNHWAHVSKTDCDPWSEPETAWHRDWKRTFGNDNSEIKVCKGETYHVADVINKNGIVFEFQNSAISAEMIIERENFYGERMVWVINGIPFKENFQIIETEMANEWQLSILDEFASVNYPDLINCLIIEGWQVRNNHVKELIEPYGFEYDTGKNIYYRDLNKKQGSREMISKKLGAGLFDLYGIHKRRERKKSATFTWDHCRRSWQEAKRPVFIDFGGDYLFQVTKNMGQKYGEGNNILRSAFLDKYAERIV